MILFVLSDEEIPLIEQEVKKVIPHHFLHLVVIHQTFIFLHLQLQLLNLLHHNPITFQFLSLAKGVLIL